MNEKRITPLTHTIELIGEGKSPLLSVVIVDSRSKTAPNMVERSIESVRRQDFAKYIGQIELIVVNNQDRFHTIGSCFNRGIDVAKGEWILFLGDDDYITVDYLLSLWSFNNNVDRGKERIVVITSFSTYVDDEKEKKALVTKAPMGMYNREYILQKRFNESIIKYVDIDFMKRTEGENTKMLICTWHFGYHYCQHNDNVSGRKELLGNSIETQRRKDV